MTWPKNGIDLEAIKRTYNQDDATEDGAEAIAFLVCIERTEYTVSGARSSKTGIDYWLGFKGKYPNRPFQKAGRLEISGIMTEAQANKVSTRSQIKLRQTTQSDYSSLPVYIIIVEFGQPYASMVLKMPTRHDLHPKAMDLAELAFRHQRKGDNAKAKKYFREALDLECRAAFLLRPSKNSEPSRSILFRSAASLAYNAQDYVLGYCLVAHGLSGFPPPEIEEELKNLYEDINFMRHLSLKGLELEERQWLMSLSGNAIGYGTAMFEAFFSRAEKVSTIFYRTVERILNVPYRTVASVSKEIKDQYGLFIQPFEARSFAVTFQIGRPNPQFPMFPKEEPKPRVDPSVVVDEIFKCFEVLESQDPTALKEIIKHEMYYENFVALAKQIAPDGDDVTLVGFNTIQNGKERPIALRRNRQQLRETINKIEEKQADKKGLIKQTYKGILRFANSPTSNSAKFGTVKLRDRESGIEHTIRVPIAIMKDVVQPYYEEYVTILVHEEGERKVLEEINLTK